MPDQRFHFFVVKEIHVAVPDSARKMINFFLFEGFGFNPLAVFIITAFRRDFTNVDFGIEVGCERVAMISGVAVDDIDKVHPVELMLSGIRDVNVRHARIEPASQEGCQPGLLKLAVHGPLGGVAEMRLIRMFVIRGVEIMGPGPETGLHNREVLVGKGNINDKFGFMLFNEGGKFFDVIGVNGRRGDFCLGRGNTRCDLLAF